MAVGGGEAEGAEVSDGYIAFAVLAVRVVGFADEGVVAQLGGKHVAAKDAFGVFIVLRIAPLPEKECGFDDVAGVVDLAAVGISAVVAAFDNPAELIANVVEPVVVEGADTLHQARVAGQVGQLGERRHDAGGGVGVGAEGLAIVGAGREEELGSGFVGELNCQFEGSGAAGVAMQLDKGADRPRQSNDECCGMEFEPALNPTSVPALVRMPQLLNGTYATLCQLDCLCAVAEPGQGVEGVKSLADVMGIEMDEGAVYAIAIEGERELAGVGEEGGAGVAVDTALIQVEAEHVFGVEEGVEMAAGYVRLGG